MTTTIIVRSGGNYVTSGTFRSGPTEENFEVGPNSERSFTPTHDNGYSIEGQDRPATAEEISTAKDQAEQLKTE